MKIIGADNSNAKTQNELVPNYKITGNKIGRVNLRVKSVSGYTKNIWINVVDNKDKKVSAKIVNGEEYTIALRSDGTVWGFGNINNENNPEKYEIPEQIVDISSGTGHILLLGKSGEVYSFGANGNGQLGTGNVTTIKAPISINLKDIAKVVANKNTSFGITNLRRSICMGRRI